MVNDAVPSTRREAPQVAVDPASGAVGVAWFDLRSGGIEVWSDRFATLVRPPRAPRPVDLLATGVSRTQIDSAGPTRPATRQRFRCNATTGIPSRAGANSSRRWPRTLPELLGHRTPRTRGSATGCGRSTPRARPAGRTAPPRRRSTRRRPRQATRRDRDHVPADRPPLGSERRPDGYEIQQSRDGVDVDVARPARHVGHGHDLRPPADTTYFFRVRALNSGGDRPFSSVASARTGRGRRAAPTGLTATVLVADEVGLSGRDRSLERDAVRDRPPRGRQPVKAWPPHRRARSSSRTRSLKAATTYTYRVRACNALRLLRTGRTTRSARRSALTGSGSMPRP